MCLGWSFTKCEVCNEKSKIWSRAGPLPQGEAHTSQGTSWRKYFEIQDGHQHNTQFYIGPYNKMRKCFFLRRWLTYKYKKKTIRINGKKVNSLIVTVFIKKDKDKKKLQDEICHQFIILVFRSTQKDTFCKRQPRTYSSSQETLSKPVVFLDDHHTLNVH